MELLFGPVCTMGKDGEELTKEEKAAKKAKKEAKRALEAAEEERAAKKAKVDEDSPTKLSMEEKAAKKAAKEEKRAKNKEKRGYSGAEKAWGVRVGPATAGPGRFRAA